MEELNPREVNIYERAKMLDVIAPIESLISSGEWELTNEGKIKVRAYRQPNRCWRLYHPGSDRLCLRWNYIYCQRYRIIPKGCRHCWKVVHKVPNLAELFRLDAHMEGFGLHGKCGVDNRMAFGGLDQCVAFWYAPLRGGLKVGRNLFKQVKEMLEAHYKSKDVDLILKRGCTEMEAMLPSDQWDRYADEFDPMEEYLDSVYEVPETEKHEIDVMTPRVHKDWIQRRARVGDPTVAMFGARPRTTVTYHDSEHKEIDFPGLGQPAFLKGLDDEQDV